MVGHQLNFLDNLQNLKFRGGGGVVDLTCYHGNHYDITIGIKELLNDSVVRKDIYR